MYILLFLATTSGTPTHLGAYGNEQSCQTAIRAIYETKYSPRGIELTSEMKQSIKQAVDIELKYQRDYKCVDANEYPQNSFHRSL